MGDQPVERGPAFQFCRATSLNVIDMIRFTQLPIDIRFFNPATANQGQQMTALEEFPRMSQNTIERGEASPESIPATQAIEIHRARRLI